LTSTLQFLIVLAIIIASAKLAGWLSSRIGQPAVLGELLAGVLLGPSVLNLLGLPFVTDTHLGDSLTHLAEIGVILLMFIAGLEVDLGQMRRAGKVVILAGILGVIVPLVMGWGATLPFGFSAREALFIGVLLTATSVSISAQTLLELGVLRGRVGIALLGAAVIDDILVILLVSALLAVTVGGGGVVSVGLLLVRLVLYLAVFGLVGRLILPRVLVWLDRLPVSESLLAGTVIIALFYAWAAEVLGGIALITGAFLAGILVAGSHLRHRVESGVHALAYGFFVPLFFVNIGLHANIWGLNGPLLWLTLVITLVAIVSKVIGGGIGARLGGFTTPDALRLGTGMISRGEVGLIVASLEIENQLVPPEILTLAVIVVLATTLVTPPLLRLTFRGTEEDAGGNVPRPTDALHIEESKDA